MRLSDFDFDLPEERIARVPLPDRSASRMLVVRRGGEEFRHSSVVLLPEEFSPGDLLVLNDSRVFPARLFGEAGERPGIEALFVRPLGGGEWLLLLRPSRRMRPGFPVRFPAAGLDGVIVRAAGEGEWVVRFPEEASVAETLERFGEIPLPPYIGRAPTEDDRERYQTVYARETGSVAAPTAGLHFTKDLLAALERKGVAIARVTLHVGPGTFRPIRSEAVEGHRMEPEHYEIPAETAGAIRSARSRGGRVIAVGTTVVRTLEAAAAGREVRAGAGWTDLFLRPPDELRVVDALLTNFHLPRSTLFLLVCAFAGTGTMRAAYGTAIDAGYRFYSYGDCMLIL